MDFLNVKLQLFNLQSLSHVTLKYTHTHTHTHTQTKLLLERSPFMLLDYYNSYGG
jgi:hypothetical protein